jgi:transposase-like protein
MSTTSQRRASQEQFWRAMLRRWHSSGLSVRGFCEEHGLAVPSFYAWRRTLARRDSAVGFVPVQVIPEPKPQTTAAGLPSSLEVVLGAGRVLRVAPGFDEPTLRRLLALLEEGRP